MRVILLTVGMRTKLVCCFSCYLAFKLEKYLQYSIGTATEQSFRYIKLTDAKIGLPKMHHYAGFWQIRSHISIHASLEFVLTDLYS